VNSPFDEYRRRLDRWARQVAKDDRAHLVYANLRIATAVAAAAVALMVMRSYVSGWWLLLPAGTFAVLVVLHARHLERADRSRRAHRLYGRGIDRLEDRWADNVRDGSEFGRDHPYARDLDLFGRGSLFQRLNGVRTSTGERTLAAWLSSGASIAEVQARQRAVHELLPMLDFREDLAVLSDEAQIVDTARLLAWADAPAVMFHRFVPALFGACAAVTVALAVAAYEQAAPWSSLLVWLLIEAAVVFAWKHSLHAVLRTIDLAERDLSPLSELLQRIETARFDAPWLASRQAALGSRGMPASAAIRRLKQLVSLLESSTHNLLFAPFTQSLLVPQQITMALGRWHAAHGPDVAGWLRIAGELEALASLAAYAYERPADPMPELLGEPPRFDALGLGHPLIADEVSVRNDVGLGGDGPQVLVVSGSNMSGKSTLLRAVGLNVVLALAGAPVRASSLRLSRVAIGATLRVDDSLQEQRSRFFAEILKIRDIVELATTSPPALFLLDEILHGTNSYDRRLGAEAIVRGLLGRGAIGLVTTHDLALTELVPILGAAAANVHFDDRLDDGRMVFDYQMRPGVVEHSNALALMRAVGLEV
jgi:hypothetical protein